MHHQFFRQLKQTASTWGIRALPGAFIIGLVVTTRAVGWLQPMEWMAIDLFLRLRPAEPIDDRIVILTISEAELKQLGYPIPNEALVKLVNQIQQHQPKVIGINILGDLARPIGNTSLYQALGSPKTVIAAEKVLPEQIPSLPGFPPTQVGFTEIYLDGDNNLRRAFLGTPNPIRRSEYKFSLAIRLAETYLQPEFKLDNGKQDQGTMAFWRNTIQPTVELPRFQPNSGGYVGADAGGVQMILSFRGGRQPFRQISLTALQTGQVQPEQITGKIVIIGITDPALRPPVKTAAIPSSVGLSGEVHGVEIQAHAVSQILSAVLDNRPLLKPWSDPWEYAWIIAWGLMDMVLCQLPLSTKQKLLSLGIATCSLLGISYALLLMGWWTPVAPALVGFLLTGVQYLALYAAYEHDRNLTAQINERQQVIEQTLNMIHNGPLQTLASLIRHSQDGEIPQHYLFLHLQQLDYELRGIRDHLNQKFLTQEGIYFNNGVTLDLRCPLDDLLSEIYSNTLERDLPNFKTLISKACNIEPLEIKDLSIKHDLARFLEESLCNVGRHATFVTKLDVEGFHHNGWYILKITDDGNSSCSPDARSSRGDGTKQAQNLAKKLNGHFQRETIPSQGTTCQLIWKPSIR